MSSHADEARRMRLEASERPPRRVRALAVVAESTPARPRIDAVRRLTRGAAGR